MLAVLALFVVLLFPSTADARCHTHKCWHRVHVNHLEKMVERKIDRITPYRCWTVTGIFRSAKPCWIITQESAMVRTGPWTALNFSSRGVPCRTRACGPYQFLGHPVPWPVLVKSKYETLKRKLAHHRYSRRLGNSHWGG